MWQITRVFTDGLSACDRSYTQLFGRSRTPGNSLTGWLTATASSYKQFGFSVVERQGISEESTFLLKIIRKTIPKLFSSETVLPAFRRKKILKVPFSPSKCKQNNETQVPNACYLKCRNRSDLSFFSNSFQGTDCFKVSQQDDGFPLTNILVLVS